MEVKGTAVKSICDFVKTNFPEKYTLWLNSLPDKSRRIFLTGVSTPDWYPIHDGAIVPTKALGDMFYNDSKKGAWLSGRYSADVALTGIYKVYVKLSSPGHIIERTSRIFAAYYQPSEITTANRTDKSVSVVITKFAQPHDVIEYRIAGWMERALEISGCKDVKVDIVKSLTKNQGVTEYRITWN